MSLPPTIAVLGAGSIGVYLGGALLAAGGVLRLIGRPRIAREVADNGLWLTDYLGGDVRLPHGTVDVRTQPEALAGARFILVTVKSHDTEAAAEDIARHGDSDAIVISFQNGIANANRLKARLPQHRVLAAMVPFNVAHLGPGHWHRGTEGRLHVALDRAVAPLVPLFAAAGLELELSADMPAVLWGKLLMNLNNAVNALSAKPLLAQLADRDYRRVLAASIAEALTVLKAAGITPAQVSRVPPARFPMLLRLPDWLYRQLASRQVRIDPKARSSMAEDLDQGRATEIDGLNGEIIRLGVEHQVPTPVNNALVELIRTAETGDPRRFSGAALRAACGV